MSKIQLRLTALTNVGCIRKNNEDNFIVCQDLMKDDWFMPQDGSEPFTLGDKGSIMVVADGMGGMNAGEVASDIAVKTVKEYFASDKLTDDIVDKPETRCHYLKQVILEADNRIKTKSKSDPETEGMGTTIVISWAIGEEVHIAWCGDSRAYSYHPNAGLRQLSKDHSYVQELVDSGKLIPELAFDHPDSNIITSSLGDMSKPAKPDVVTTPLHEGEIILLCSDGLCGMLRDSEMLQVLDAYYPDLSLCKKDLIEGALSAGGHDNVTLTMTLVAKGGGKMPSLKKEPTSSDNQPANSISAKPDKSNKKKNVVMSIIIVALLAIIGVLCLKLIGNKQDSTLDVPAQETVDSTALKKDKVSPKTDTVKTDNTSTAKKGKSLKERVLEHPNTGQENEHSGDKDSEINSTPNATPTPIKKTDNNAGVQKDSDSEPQN